MKEKKCVQFSQSLGCIVCFATVHAAMNEGKAAIMTK